MRAERPRSAGRHSAQRITAAKATRSTPRRRGRPRRTASSRTRRRTGPSATPPSTRTVGGIRSARIMAVHRTAARERTYEELERIFAGVDAPFAFVDLDAMWSNADEMLRRAQGTPIRVASKSVRCRSLLERDPRERGAGRRLPGPDDVHAPGVALAPRARLRRPAARLPDRRPRRARRAPADRGRRRADPDGGLGRAPRPDRVGGRRRRATDPGLHRGGPELVAARRPREDRREALPDPDAARRRRRSPARSRAGRGSSSPR